VADGAPSGEGAPLPDAAPHGDASAPLATAVTDDWRQLDARVLMVHLARLLIALAPIAFVLVLGGSLDGPVRISIAFIFGGAALSAARDALSWATTRYRVGEERVELRSGLLLRAERSVPRDRVRTVHLTAKLLHRAFGITTVDIGTGSRDQRRLRLDAVPVAEAGLLRMALLARGEGSEGGGVESVAIATEVSSAPPGETLARLRWGWVPYHVLSPWTLVLPVLGVGALVNVLEQLGVQDDVGRAIEGAAVDSVHRADTLPAWLIVLLALVGAIALFLLGAIGASAQFLESWWEFRLTREPGGNLHVRRGLLTARSISIERRRLRGLTISEPLLQRAVGGASVRAIVSGLRDASDGRAARVDALLPNVPRSEADQVVAQVLQEPDVPTLLRSLRPHPWAALRRRFVRALAGAAVPVAVLALLGPARDLLPSWLWIASLLLIAPALLLGRDAYRGLGHRLAGPYVVARRGTLVRRTHALQRDGVIGWNVRRSFFQRRAGLVTLTATTAAGSGAYEVVDIGEHDALAFAEEAIPGLLAPFLERSASR
jgi:putative membrane protein